MERGIQHADRRRRDVSVAILSTDIHLVAVASYWIRRRCGLLVILSLVINLYRLVVKIYHFEILYFRDILGLLVFALRWFFALDIGEISYLSCDLAIVIGICNQFVT